MRHLFHVVMYTQQRRRQYTSFPDSHDYNIWILSFPDRSYLKNDSGVTGVESTQTSRRNWCRFMHKRGGGHEVPDPLTGKTVTGRPRYIAHIYIPYPLFHLITNKHWHRTKLILASLKFNNLTDYFINNKKI
ncbi:uncharacterized protein LOC116186075 [Apis dorsata]|uniref:uncharacterized protein LOC116186075 n=1 Tax=Apis dorsata TaxID=7462 RepID=UPI0012936A1D|nr:uncharacterized protein LOC116186075 [Apis dorsata]